MHHHRSIAAAASVAVAVITSPDAISQECPAAELAQRRLACEANKDAPLVSRLSYREQRTFLGQIAACKANAERECLAGYEPHIVPLPREGLSESRPNENSSLPQDPTEHRPFSPIFLPDNNSASEEEESDQDPEVPASSDSGDASEDRCFRSHAGFEDPLPGCSCPRAKHQLDVQEYYIEGLRAELRASSQLIGALNREYLLWNSNTDLLDISRCTSVLYAADKVRDLVNTYAREGAKVVVKDSGAPTHIRVYAQKALKWIGRVQSHSARDLQSAFKAGIKCSLDLQGEKYLAMRRLRTRISSAVDAQSYLSVAIQRESQTLITDQTAQNGTLKKNKRESDKRKA